MEKDIIVFTESKKLLDILKNLKEREGEKIDYSFLFAGSRKELVESIVKNNAAVALIMEESTVKSDKTGFLSSLKRSFPLLKIYEIQPKDLQQSSIQFIISEIDKNIRFDRRESHRFSWPITSGVIFDFEEKFREKPINLSKDSNLQEIQLPPEVEWKSYRMADLSAGGAYLYSNEPPPARGTKGLIKIRFQDASLMARFEVLDARYASSTLSPGFSIRFLNLSEKTSNLIQRIINDSLVKSILEPWKEPEIPTIGEESLGIDGFSID